MKLLFIVNVDWFFCSHRLPIALAASRKGYEVHIATTITKPRYRDVITRCGLTLHELEIDRSGKDLASFFLNFWRIFSICKTLQPNIVHLVTIQPVLIGGLAANLAGVKRVVYAISGLGHVFLENSSFRSRLRCVFVKYLYRLALTAKFKAIIFQNNIDQLAISRLCSLTSNESYLISGSGVNLLTYTFESIPAGRPIILMASRILATKGVREFVEAAKIINNRGLHACFQLVGQSDFSNPAAIPSSELSFWSQQGFIELLGHRNDIQHLMAMAHVVCLPSYYPEGLPKVLCEAAACGRAVVTTDEPGCRDAIENGVTGFLVPSRNSLALANTIENLLLNPDLIRKMGCEGRKRAEQLFDVNAIIDKHLKIYTELLTKS